MKTELKITGHIGRIEWQELKIGEIVRESLFFQHWLKINQVDAFCLETGRIKPGFMLDLVEVSKAEICIKD